MVPHSCSIILRMAKISVIMVCRANICRSTMAEAMLRHIIRNMGMHRKVKVDSAGTRASQPGHKPDVRAQRIMAEMGISMAKIKARQVTEKDLHRNDLVIAMDSSNYEDLIAICPEDLQHKIILAMSCAKRSGERDVPDPYFGTMNDFESVFWLLDKAMKGLSVELVDSVT